VSLDSTDAWLQKITNDVLSRKWLSVKKGLEKFEQVVSEQTRLLTKAQFAQLKSIKRTLHWLDTPVLSNNRRHENPLDFANTCVFSIATVVSTDKQKDYLSELIQEFHKVIPQSRGTYCFGPAIVDLRVMAICRPDSLKRAHCKQGLLESLVAQYDMKDVSHFIVLSDIGRENARGGVIFLNDDSTVEVLLHEIGHWIGLIDEYSIRDDQKEHYCHSSGVQKLGQNLVVAPTSWPKDEVSIKAKQKGIIGKSQRLFEVDTCKGTMVQAYKKQEKISPMEYLDAIPNDEFLEYFLQPVLQKQNSFLLN
jgi:hypothetical protein